MALDTDSEAALRSEACGFFTGVEIAHPNGTIRLLDGPGVLNFNSELWTGNQAIGSLGNIRMDESGGDEAPELTVTILPADTTVIPAYAIPSAQGAVVKWWAGAFNPATGAVIGQPDLRFYGVVDTVPWSSGATDKSLTFVAVSGFDKFFTTDDGAILSDSFHQSVWPGELGFQYQTAVSDPMPWGIDGAKPVLTFQ